MLHDKKSCSVVAVVDDDESVCRALTRLLRSAGLEDKNVFLRRRIPQIRSDRTAGLRGARSHMPEMNGFEVQERLAQAGVQLPVIIITGHDSPESRERALALGPTLIFASRWTARRCSMPSPWQPPVKLG
jgi:FixJ family two-component response regulator